MKYLQYLLIEMYKAEYSITSETMQKVEFSYISRRNIEICPGITYLIF